VAFGNAFVTGASSGIGQAIAMRLAERGAVVVLAARRKDELERVATEIRSRGGKAETCVLDVADNEAAAKAVENWDRDLGGLELVIANAGMNEPQRPAALDWKTVSRIMGVNAMGALATLVSAVRPMVARRNGTLAAVTSLAAMRGLPGHAAYSASKACVSTFLEALRVDLAPHGVRVVDIRPGFVDTPMTQKNKFAMPFMIDAERAAKLTVRGLERGVPCVMYPWQLSFAMSFAQSMPDAIWRGVAPKLPR
jgi:short-subunit dehydrogenase